MQGLYHHQALTSKVPIFYLGTKRPCKFVIDTVGVEILERVDVLGGELSRGFSMQIVHSLQSREAFATTPYLH